LPYMMPLPMPKTSSESSKQHVTKRISWERAWVFNLDQDDARVFVLLR